MFSMSYIFMRMCFVGCVSQIIFVLSITNTNQVAGLNPIGDTEGFDGVKSVKDLKKNEIFSHLLQNGAREGDFNKPSTEFMMNVFENLLQGERLAAATGHSDSRDKPAIAHADTVRSFSAKSEGTSYRIHIPTLPVHEEIKMAEIRFQGIPSFSERPTFSVRVVTGNFKTLHKFRLSRKSKQKGNSYMFDVTGPLVSTISGFKGNITLNIKQSNIKDFRKSDDVYNAQPILILYSQDKQFLKTVYASFKEKSSSNVIARSKREVLSRKSNQNGRKRKRNRWRRKKSKNEKCQLYDFKVDFDVIGWGPWIIHPKTFNSKVCYGQCPEPIGNEYSPTNHAMLQTLMRIKRPLSAPEPCCVPTKLRPLSMLYFEYDDIVVRHHEEMVAAECGCR